MTEWRDTTIGEIAAPDRYSVVGGPFGSALGRKDYVGEGVPVIRGAQLAGPAAFVDHDFVFVNEEKADRHRGNLAYPGDVIVTQRGTVGQIGRVPERASFPRYLLSQSQMKLTVDRSRADARFIYYALLSPGVQQILHGSTISAGVPHINLATFRELRLALPSLSTQNRVSAILGHLDDLIENNRRRIELLEQMAQATYREWFVHFRYPDYESAALVDSPLGPIPYGWQVRNLFDVAEVAFGYSFKSKAFATAGPYPVVRIRDVPGGTTKTFSDEKAPLRYCVLDGDILIGMDGDFHLRQWTGGEAWLNQRVARLRPLGGLSPRHLLLSIDQPIKEWNAAISGTTVAHLGKRHLEKIQIVVPPAELLTIASEVFAQGAQHECTLAQTNSQLAGIRDLLLPKLVTGQIDVSNLDLGAALESVA